MKMAAARGVTSAFTLIELLISAALAGMILVAAYMCLSSAVATQKLIEPRVDVLQNARVAMNLITSDLRSACQLSTDLAFLGTPRAMGTVEADNLDFATHNYSPQHPREADFCEVSYFLEPDRRTGQYVLWRRRNPTISQDPLAGGAREEIARGLHGLRFEYYDGLDWYDSWGDLGGKIARKGSRKEHPNLYGMPTAVRVTLMFDREPAANPVKTDDTGASGAAPEPPPSTIPPLVLQSVAFLELAAAGERQSAPSAGTNNTAIPNNGNTANPGPDEGGINQ